MINKLIQLKYRLTCQYILIALFSMVFYWDVQAAGLSIDQSNANSSKPDISIEDAIKYINDKTKNNINKGESNGIASTSYTTLKLDSDNGYLILTNYHTATFPSGGTMRNDDVYRVSLSNIKKHHKNISIGHNVRGVLLYLREPKIFQAVFHKSYKFSKYSKTSTTKISESYVNTKINFNTENQELAERMVKAVKNLFNEISKLKLKKMEDDMFSS